MGPAVYKLFMKVKPMARRILRARGFYTIHDLMLQYKTHVWGAIQHATPALYDACPSVLSRLDSVQSSFVQHHGLTDEEAFMDNNFSPPASNRDIAMLGLLYKIAHNMAAQHYWNYSHECLSWIPEPLVAPLPCMICNLRFSMMGHNC